MTFPASDHFNGKTFFNRDHVDRTWRDVLRWRRTSRSAAWPAHVPLTPHALPSPPRGGEWTFTWVGHATFLIQTAQGNFLTDPQFSHRCGPFGLFGPTRVQPPGLPLDALPRIDYVLLSHDHYDHCDLTTLRALALRHDPLVLTPLANAPLIRRSGLRRIVELDWWERHALDSGATVTLTPARHWSNRLSGRRNARLWGGFYVSHSSGSWWFAADTAYDATLFHSIRERLGAPEVAMIPIGAYEPRWFMAPQHCNPAEAVQIHRDVAARMSLAMHWGTWPLTDEARDEPLRALAAAREGASVSAEAFRVLTAGETALCGASHATSPGTPTLDAGST